MKGFSKRNPNFYVFNAVLHLDEATPHIHIDYIPIGHYTCGVDTQNGLSQALKEMGYVGIDAINKWRLAERKVLEEICNACGIQIKEPEKGRGSFAVEAYKEYKDTISDLQSQVEIQEQQIRTDKERLSQIAKKKANIEAVENIEAKPTLIGNKVTLAVEDYDNLKALAQKHIASERKDKKLKAEVAELKREVQTLSDENAAFKQKQEGTMKLRMKNGELQNKIDTLEKVVEKVWDFAERLGLKEQLELFLKPSVRQREKFVSR
jgi:DNA repair exonuclease SbcCD ATPase subunit